MYSIYTTIYTKNKKWNLPHLLTLKFSNYDTKETFYFFYYIYNYNISIIYHLQRVEI